MSKSFTLIELLIVVIIVGILATVALPQYNKAVTKARWVEAVSMLGTIRTACQIYYQGHGVKPNPESFYAFLNGAVHDSGNPRNREVSSWLAIDVPAPTRPAGQYRFIYALYLRDDNQNRVAWCHHERTDANDGFNTGQEEYIDITYDGELISHDGAPNF